MTDSRWRVWLALIVLGTVWGASYLFIKVGGAEITPLTFVATRVTVAGLVVAGLLLATRQAFPPAQKGVWGRLLVMGVCNGVIPYTLITWGETQIPSGLAGILVAAMPIFTVILAHRVTPDEKLNSIKFAGIGLGFLGVVILFLPDLHEGFTLSFLGAFVTVLAAISYAFATVFAHRYLRDISNLGAEFGQLATGAVLLIPASLIVEHPWTLRPSMPAVLSLLTLSVIGTAFAYLLYYWLIEHAGATSTALVTYISPVTSVALGFLVLGERLDWTALVGFAGIVGGVMLVGRGAPRAAQPPIGVEAD